MPVLTKEQLLATTPNLKVEKVAVPEWGDGATVCVRELSGDERDRYEQIVHERDGNFVGLRAALVAIGLCDESGEPMGFSELEVEQLGSKGGGVIDRLFERVKTLSGMNADAVEDAEKN